MAQLLVRGTSSAWNSVPNKAEYADSIVFLTDTNQIVVNGIYYGMSKEASDRLDAVITKVDNLKYFNGISNGVETYMISSPGILTITGEGDIVTDIDETKGLVIKVSIKEGTTNGTISVNGTDVAVHGLGSAAYKDESYFGKATEITDLQDQIDDITANSLSVSTTDKVLSVTGTTISSKLTLEYNKTDKRIYLRGKDDSTFISEIDTTDFIVDGQLANAELDGDELVLTFNTDSGKQPIRIDLSKYIDAYDGSNLKLKPIEIPTEYTDPKGGDSINEAIALLIKKDRELKSEIDTLNSDNLIEVEKGTDGNFVTTTVTSKTNNKQKVSVSVTTKEIANASNADNGLATAYDVKTYIDNMFKWEELN